MYNVFAAAVPADLRSQIRPNVYSRSPITGVGFFSLKPTSSDFKQVSFICTGVNPCTVQLCSAGTLLGYMFSAKTSGCRSPGWLADMTLTLCALLPALNLVYVIQYKSRTHECSAVS